MIKYILFLGIITWCFQVQPDDPKPCLTAYDCTDLNNPCPCYSAKECKLRSNEATDFPIFELRDSARNYCYCTPWDFDNYKKLCAAKE